MAEESVDIRARLVGRRQFLADARAAGAGIRNLEQQTHRYERAADRAGRRSFAWNQAMFTARRILYDFTLGVGAAAGAVALLGFNFNRNMESSTVALGFLLGSEQAARQELELLYDLAARTPFQFQDLTEASRRFLSWGFSIETTNRALAATADAMAAMGGDPTIIQRVVRALGQINTQGRVLGEELNQLAEAGINARRYLVDAFGLTGDQVARIGELGIPAAAAIEAIIAGMEKAPSEGGFKGASEALADTVTGQLTTIADYGQQLFGMIMMAPFEAFRDQMPGFISLLKTAAESMRDEGFFAMIGDLDAAAGAGGRLVAIVDYIAAAGANLADVFVVGVLPALQMTGGITVTYLVPIMRILGSVLGFLADNAWAISPALKLLALYLLVTRIQMVLLWTYTKLLTAAFWLWGFAIRFVNKETKLQIFLTKVNIAITWLYIRAARAGAAATALWTVFTRGYIRGANGQFVALTRVQRAVFLLRLALLKSVAAIVGATAATWGFTVALLANPLTWIVLAVVAVVGGLILLEVKFNAVSRSVQWLWDKMKAFYNWLTGSTVWKVMSTVLKWSPLGIAARATKWGIGRIPGLAAGGHVIGGGTALVGERGPELVRLPAAATVQPLQNTWGDQRLVLTTSATPLVVDGRELGEVVFEHRLERFARQ